MKTLETTSPASVLFEIFLTNGEIAGKADCVAFLKEERIKLPAPELAKAWNEAANRFVESMSQNEVDTAEGGGITREDAIARIARWEAMRPAAGCPVMPGEWIAAVRHAVDCYGARGAKNEIRLAWSQGYTGLLREVSGRLQRMRNSQEGRTILGKMVLSKSFSNQKLRMEDWACKVGDALRRAEAVETPAMTEAVAFFFNNAGFSYFPDRETPAEGKLRNARSLAEAEGKASRLGYSFHWELDGGTNREWTDEGEETPTWVCTMRAPDGTPADSIGGVDFGDGEPWGNPYRRVVEAELAAESVA